MRCRFLSVTDYYLEEILIFRAEFIGLVTMLSVGTVLFTESYSIKCLMTPISAFVAHFFEIILWPVTLFFNIESEDRLTYTKQLGKKLFFGDLSFTWSLQDQLTNRLLGKPMVAYGERQWYWNDYREILK